MLFNTIIQIYVFKIPIYFQVLELICKGAFGKVYKVKQLNSDDELFAMKILNKSLVTIILSFIFFQY